MNLQLVEEHIILVQHVWTFSQVTLKGLLFHQQSNIQVCGLWLPLFYAYISPPEKFQQMQIKRLLSEQHPSKQANMYEQVHP
uniref:Uncharacterized protein MANES_14G041100 n=1 Tax=Rhizophora mucronata TaxID=61149 RepID=A0A2P2LSX2_RHIMU